MFVAFLLSIRHARPTEQHPNPRSAGAHEKQRDGDAIQRPGDGPAIGEGELIQGHVGGQVNGGKCEHRSECPKPSPIEHFSRTLQSGSPLPRGSQCECCSSVGRRAGTLFGRCYSANRLTFPGFISRLPTAPALSTAREHRFALPTRDRNRVTAIAPPRRIWQARFVAARVPAIAPAETA